MVKVAMPLAFERRRADGGGAILEADRACDADARTRDAGGERKALADS